MPEPTTDTRNGAAAPEGEGLRVATAGNSEATTTATTTAPSHVDVQQEEVELRKSIKITGAIAILLGNIGGAATFIAPTTILKLCGSPGVALVMWFLGGAVTATIAVSVCELALLLPKAGGPYFYTMRVFGTVPGFIILWGFVILIGFSSWALAGYTASLYMLSLVFPDCKPPESAVKLLAAWLLLGLVALNCTYTKYVTKFQKFFTVSKVIAMVTIITSGFINLPTEHGQNNVSQFMDDTNVAVGPLALSLFAGYFSYGGWQIMTMLIEEVHDPVKEIPRALSVSFCVAITFFVLTNFAYYVVLTPSEVMQTDAVAMTFGQRVHPTLPYLLAVTITLCCIGSINVTVMGQPRILYAAARLGHMPRLFAMLHHKFLTPWPATFVMYIGAMYMLLSGTVSSLISYISLFVGIMQLVLLLALLYLRRTQPEVPHPIRVPLALLISQILLTSFLIIVSVYEKPHELGGCVLLLLSAVPVYFIFVAWKNKPKAFVKAVDGFTDFVSTLLNLKLPSTYGHK